MCEMHPKREWTLATLIILGAAALRLALLLTSQSAADGDEAIVGVMAKHVLEDRARPWMFYGQNFGGGGVIEAWIAAGFYALFGMSAATLKAAGLLISTAAMIAVWLFARRFWGASIGLLALALFGLAPTWVEWGLKARGGHVLSIVFILACCWIAYDGLIRGEGRRKWLAGFLFGVAAGLTYWNMQFSATVLAMLGLVWWMSNPGLPLKAEFWLFLSGLCVGLAPLAAHAAQVDQSLLQTLLPESRQTEPFTLYRLARRGYHLGFQKLPSLYTPHLDHTAWVHYSWGPFPRFMPPYAWLYALAVGGGCLALALTLWKKIRMNESVRHALVSLEGFILLLIAFHFALLILQRNVKIEPRHLIPLTPFFAIAAARMFLDWAKSTRRGIRVAGIVAPILWIGWGIVLHLWWMQGPPVFESAGSVSDRIPQSEVDEAIDWLDSQGIQYVYSSNFLLEWKLIFDSRERIIASRIDGGNRYMPYLAQINQAVVREGKPYAILFPDTLDRKSVEELAGFREFALDNGLRLQRKDIGEHLTFFYGNPMPIFGEIQPAPDRPPTPFHGLLE